MGMRTAVRIIPERMQNRTPCRESGLVFVLRGHRKIPAQHNTVIPEASITASALKAVLMIDTMTDEAAVMVTRRLILNGHSSESLQAEWTRKATALYVTMLATRAPSTRLQFMASVMNACVLSTRVVINAHPAMSHAVS